MGGESEKRINLSLALEDTEPGGCWTRICGLVDWWTNILGAEFSSNMGSKDLSLMGFQEGDRGGNRINFYLAFDPQDT